MLTKWEELQLIARCVAGDDRRAFGRLVEEYNDGLRRFLLNLTLGDAALTDDLAQDTFLKAYMAIRSFQGLARFRTWLYRIAYNEYYAHTRRRQEMLPQDDGRPYASDYGIDTQGADDARMDVENCLRLLSDAERSVVLLFYLDDRPIKEISKITGMPEGTIKSHLSRAKGKMAKAFHKTTT